MEHQVMIFQGEYYFINGNNLSDGRIEIKQDTKKVNEAEFQKYKKELNENTVFVSINGTLGNVAFYNNEKVILGKSACYFNLLKKDMKDYIYWLLKTKYYLDYANEESTGTTIKNVSLAAMRKFPIPLPPLAEQKRIVTALEQFMPLVEEYGKKESEVTSLNKDIAKKLKNAILQEAVQGKLLPQNPADESASVLLERIRAEQAKNSRQIGAYKKYAEICLDEQPFDLPENWLWVHLGDICDYGKCTNVEAGDLKADDWILDLEDIEKDSGKIIAFKNYGEIKSKSTKHRFKKGDVLYNKLRPYPSRHWKNKKRIVLFVKQMNQFLESARF